MPINKVKAIVEIEDFEDGRIIVTLRHPKHGGQWLKMQIANGGSVVTRAVEAVYGSEQAGDADAFLKAYGMSDAEAFNAETWTRKKSFSLPRQKK